MMHHGANVEDGVRASTQPVGVQAYRADFRAELHGVRAFDPIQGVRKSHRIARIRLCAAVLGTVRADQAADNSRTAGYALPTDARDDRRPGEVDGYGRKIYPVHAQRHAVDARLRTVVSELRLIDERRA